MFALVAAVLFVIGAIATATDSHTALGQGHVFWFLLGLAAWALHQIYPIAVRGQRRP